MTLIFKVRFCTGTKMNDHDGGIKMNDGMVEYLEIQKELDGIVEKIQNFNRYYSLPYHNGDNVLMMKLQLVASAGNVFIHLHCKEE